MQDSWAFGSNDITEILLNVNKSNNMIAQHAATPAARLFSIFQELEILIN
jgi:hypothetical protein